jgi:hypothetical protein
MMQFGDLVITKSQPEILRDRTNRTGDKTVELLKEANASLAIFSASNQKVRGRRQNQSITKSLSHLMV